jgi:uncharacterized protein YcbX
MIGRGRGGRGDTRGMSQGPDRVVGSVVATQAFPVKGAGAAQTGRVTVDAAGVVGDRRHAVLGEAGDVLTADTEPRLRELLAAPDADGVPLVTVPSAAVGVRGQQADDALSAFLGRPVRLAAVPPARTLDAPVHLVTRQALDAAARGEHDAADCACSLSEPRANLVVDAPGEREESWVGRRLAIGDVVLRVVRRPGHCLGIYAEVDVPGTVDAGALVAVLAEQRDGQEAPG